MIKQSIKIASTLRRRRPNIALVLTANNVTMSLDWIYNGPPCDGFHIFLHLPGDAAGVFNDHATVLAGVRTWATNLDDPADAFGYKYYIVPTDDNGNALAPPSNIVNFAAG